MAAPGGPLPDFAAIRSHLTEAGDRLTEAGNQITLCANLPSIQDGNQITALLRQINENIQRLGDEVGTLRGEVGTLRGEVGTLRGEVGTLREEVGTLRGELRAEKRNSVSRLVNTRVTNAGVPIEPLVGEDGQPIPEFPETVQALRGLEDDRLDQILGRLGLSTAGTSAAKKDRIQMHAGVINIPQGRLR